MNARVDRPLPPLRLLCAALAAALLPACSLAPAPREPVIVRDLPAAYGGEAVDTARASERWWRVFRDPVLESLVDTALAANLDLREAVARVEEVRQRYRIARSDLFPALGLQGDVAYTSQPTNVGFAGEFGDEEGAPGDGGGAPGGLAGFLPDRLDFTTYTASLGFSYEVDFWGRARNETKAAVRDFLASAADYHTARLAVIAATISTYLEVVELRRAIRLTALSVDLLSERAELTNERYYRGLVSTFELYTIQGQFRNAQAALPLLDARLEDAKGRLAVLLGRYAGRIDRLLADSPPPAIVLDPVPADLPVALLEDRPDVAAAWQRLEAARYRIGARKAQLYPTLRLSATAGLQSSDISDLFRIDQHFLNLIGGLVQPLFQGGRLRANVGVAEARFHGQAAAYVRTVITAFKEVRSSLRNLERQTERYDFLSRQRASAQGSAELQLRAFQRGVGDYLEYLDARRNLVSVETSLAAAERDLAEARLAVHRALGGAWLTEAATAEFLSDEYEKLEADLVPFAPQLVPSAKPAEEEP